MKNILFLISFLVVISGCKPGEVVNKGKEKTETVILKKMIDNDIDFDWFSSKIKTDYKSGDESMSVTLQVKIEKDKQIWISGQKFGLEGMRMLIDQDSIRVLNRLKRTYEVTDFSYIAKEFNLPANFEAIQNFLVGNALKLGDDAVYNLKNSEIQTILIGVENNLRATYSLNKLNFNLEEFLLEDTKASRQVLAKQLDYQKIDKKGDFSYLREIELSSEKTENIFVKMAYSRVEFDEKKSMSFTVPSSYKRL